MIPCDDQHDDRNVMTEAVFAGEEVKELPDENGISLAASSCTKLTAFPKNFFVGYSPRYTGDRYRQYKKPGDLCTQIHCF